MHASKLLLALGITLAAPTKAVPVLSPTPTLAPLFTVVSRIPEGTASGVANATAGKFPTHQHTPDCEHNLSGNRSSTSPIKVDTHNSTTEDKGHVREGEGNDAESTGHPSPYPDIGSSSCAPPNSAQAHNHTGYHCAYPSHHNRTATDATYDQATYPEKVNASRNSSHTHTGNRCAHPSHHNGTRTARHDYDERSMVPEVNVTVCLGAECKATELVTAKVDDSGRLTGIRAQNGNNGVVRRQDTDLSYEDIARQMSGARIAGGV